MTEDWRKRFDEKFVGAMPTDLMVITVSRGEWLALLEKQKDFIASALTTRTEQAVAEERERVRESREVLAEIEHEQWIAWSKNIAETEPDLNPDRLIRWSTLWRPYSELTEAEKDQDREWADKVLSALQDPRRGEGA